MTVQAATISRAKLPLMCVRRVAARTPTAPLMISRSGLVARRLARWRCRRSSAAQESHAVVIDIAGPVPVVVEGSRLAALAAGGDVPAMHEDPDVWRQVVTAAADAAPGIRVKLSRPAGDLDFTLELAPPEGSPGLVSEDVANQIAAAVHDRLPYRIRAGIAVIRRPG